MISIKGSLAGLNVKRAGAGRTRGSRSRRALTAALVATALACAAVFAHRSASARSACTPPPSGMVGWWPGDGDAKDIQGGFNGGTVGTATFAAGEVGQAFSFDGSTGDGTHGSGVVISRDGGSDPLNMGTSDFTVDAWVRIPTDAPSAYKVVFDDGYGPFNNLIRLEVVNLHGSFHFRDNAGNEVIAEGTTALNDGAWHHLAGVRSGTSGTIYVDGALEKTFSNSAVGSVDTNCGVAMIGAAQSSTFCRVVPDENPFTGQIDEVEVFRRALSQTEIQAIVNAGSAGKCKPTCTAPPSGLVSWWTGDNTANDLLGNNNGTLVSGGYAQAKVGSGFSLNGTTDYVSVPDSASLYPQSGSFTVDAWIKTSQTTGFQEIINHYECAHHCAPGSNSDYELYVNSGKLDGFIRDTTGASQELPGTTTVADGLFHHVAMQRDIAANKMVLYLDGAIEASATLIPTGAVKDDDGEADPVTIGAVIQNSDSDCGCPVSLFSGKIDEVDYFDRALSQSEIQAIFNSGSAGKCGATCTPPPSGMVGWWPGDGNASDIQNGNDGTLQNGATFASGKVGQAFSFDGTNDFVNIPDAPSLRPSSLTIDAWVNPTDVSQDRAILIKSTVASGGNDFAYGLRVLAGGHLEGRVAAAGGASASVQSSSVLATNTFQHVAFTYDGATMTLYINGVADGTTATSITPDPNSNPVSIGAWQSVSAGTIQFWPGQIDEVELFNRALTQTEVQSIFNAGSFGKCKSGVPQPTVQSATRADANPTNAAGVHFNVTFSKPVTGVDATDFTPTTAGSISGASVSGVAGSGANYTVTVSTGTGDGTIRLDVSDDDTIVDAAGNPLGGTGAGNGSFTSGQAYTIDKTAPGVTINQASGQADPTGTSPINFTAVFSEPVTGFNASDVSFTGSTAGGTLSATVTEVAPNNGTTYNVAVSGMTTGGTVVASTPAGAATDAVGNQSSASTSTDNSVTFNNTAPLVSSVTRADANPTNASSIHFTVTFSESVTGVDSTDFTLTTTGSVSGASVAGVSGSGASYTVTVNTGTGDGTIRLDVVDDDSIKDAANHPLGGAGAGNGSFTSGQVYTVDKTPPSISIGAPSASVAGVGGSVTYTVTYSDANFSASTLAPGNITLNKTGTANATVGVSGTGNTRTVTLSGLTGNGTIGISIAAGTATDTAGNAAPAAGPSATFTVDTTPPTVQSVTRADANPTSASSVHFTVTFSESVTGVDSTDFSLTNTGSISGASVTGVTGSGAAYTVTVNTGTGSGTIRLDVGDNDSIKDAAGNPLGGTGAGNGSFNSGETYTLNRQGGTLQFSSATYSVGENGGTATITVRRTGGSFGAVSVAFATSNGTAAGGAGCGAGVDFVNTSGTLSWADGETADKSFNVTVCGDTSNEPDETVSVALSNPAGGAALGSPAAATLTILNDDTPVLQFSPSAYSVAEDCTAVQIIVNRTGDPSVPVAVDYQTADGAASERADYTTALGTLRFAAGETQKTFVLLISEDTRAESDEALTVTLSNPSGGAVLGPAATATVTIQDDADTGAGNSIDDSQTFVRQHYHDFLNREPDAAGLQFWTQGITSCGADARCVQVKRVDTSAAFFLSIEFQRTGFEVIRVYKATFTDSQQRPRGLPRYREFLRDEQEVSRGVVVGQGNWQQQLSDNVLDFARAWVQRPEVLAALPDALPAQAYVDKLFQNSGVTPTQAERDAAVSAFGAGGTEGRARALLSATDSGSVFNRQFNAAFVLMEYIGYLRRNPDDAPDSDYAGFDFWLSKLNGFSQPGEDMRDDSQAFTRVRRAEMVRAFIESVEYRGRFAP